MFWVLKKVNKSIKSLKSLTAITNTLYNGQLGNNFLCLKYLLKRLSKYL